MNAQTKKLLSELSKIPLRVAVEQTNVCNANCSFCGYRFMSRKKGIMDFNTYKRLLEQVKEINSPELKFTPLVGDPLVDKEIIEKIQYAKSLGCFKYIYTYTNLIGLKKERVDDFVTSGLNAVTISTNLQSREAYKRLYGVDAFERVIDNICTLFEANTRNGNPVCINITLKHDAGYEKPDSSPYYKKISKMIEKIEVLNEGYDNWCGLIKKEDIPVGQSFRKVKNKNIPCSQIYNGFIITHNGDVGVCWARDVDMKLKIGNIHESTLAEMWQGKRLEELRHQWFSDEIPEPCKYCLQYTSVLDHPLVLKYVAKNAFKYPRLLVSSFAKNPKMYTGKFVDIVGKALKH